MRVIKEDKMRIGRGLVISFAILACTIIPGNIYALTALDFSKYLPDQIGEFNATGDVSSEDLTKDNGMFHRAQRFYGSKNGALCILAVVKGAGVPLTIEETFAKGSKINLEEFDAVQIIPDNNSVVASVKLGQDLLATAVVLNTKDKNIPVSILKEINLRDLSILGAKDVVQSSLNIQPKNLLPPFNEELRGNREVRIKNPNNFKVLVSLKSGNKGKDFEVASNGISSVLIPDGTYQIFFVYSNKPDALFQGDDFVLNNNGIEIQIVKVVGGNYGIKQVK